MSDPAIWPRVLISACIADAAGRVLVTRHPPSMRWHLPDGDLRRGERVADAIRRSVREDLGIDVEPEASPFHVTETIASSGAPHYVTLHVVTRCADGAFSRIAPAPGIDFRFVVPTAGDTGPFLAASREAIAVRFGRKR